ncbi:MAG: hypothetical protein ACRELV_11305 [Longimicrobiales bacterium]
MRAAVLILACFGVIAIIRHLVRAAFGVARRGVDAFMARETAEIRARRGDLTGLAEADERAGLARRGRLRAGLVLSAWVAVLLAPLATPWTAELYALCAALWLRPRRQGEAARS